MERLRAYGRYPETWLLVVLLACRAVLAATLGSGRDEAAYWYWAWNGLDASYSFVTGAALRVTTALFGDGPLALRLSGLLAGWAAVCVLISACRGLGMGRRAAIFAGIALAASPWQGYAGTVVHPDSFLLLFVLVFAERIAGIARDPSRAGRRLPVAAAAAALAALTKPTGALLLIPAAVGLWAWRREGRGGARIALGILAAAAFAVTLALDSRILTGIRELGRFAPNLPILGRISLVMAELSVQAGPAFLVTALAGIAAFRYREVRASWPGWMAGALFVAFFTSFLVAGQAKGNWFLPGLALFLPPGALVLERAASGRWTRAFAGGSIALSLGLGLIWTLPAQTGLWELLKGNSWVHGIDRTYLAHVGEREQAVSATRCWTGRLEEYHREEEIDARIQLARSEGVQTILSNDYGLACETARRMGRDVRVLLPWDPVFARTCDRELRPGEDVVFVSRTWRTVPEEWAGRFREIRIAKTREGEPPVNVLYCLQWMGDVMARARGTR